MREVRIKIRDSKVTSLREHKKGRVSELVVLGVLSEAMIVH